jgi:spermidine synthase
VLPLTAVWIVLLSVRMPGDLFRRTVALNRWMQGYEVLDIKEGINTTVSVHRNAQRDVLYLCTSGRKVAGTSRGYRADQKMLGHFPVLLNEQARRVLSVGFGSGESTACLAKHALERIDCVEIAPEVVDLSLKYFGDLNPGDQLHERVNMIYQDARNYLHLTDRRYDVIVNDCTSIRGVADNASLYTREYFEIARRRLTPDGWFMSWIDAHTNECSDVMRSVIGTFSEVFGHVTLWYMATESAPFFVIVGSERPQRFSPRHIEGELARPAVAESLSLIGCRTSQDVLSCYVGDEDDLKRYVATYATNSDYFPVVEFCREYEPAGYDALRAFFTAVRRRSIDKHIDWTGMGESEQSAWLAQFEKVYDATTCVVAAESAADWFERLRQGTAGRRILPAHPGLTLIAQNAEHALLEASAKSIEAGNAGRAMETARRMLEIDPNCALAWVVRARAERSLGNLAAAKADALRALEIAPDDLTAHVNLWSVLVSTDDTGAAAAILRADLRSTHEGSELPAWDKSRVLGF